MYFDLLVDKTIRGVLRLISIFLFILLTMFLATLITDVPTRTARVKIEKKSERTVIPTAPLASIVEFDIEIIGATDAERRTIEEAMAFYGARTTSIFRKCNGKRYIRKIWVCPNNHDGHLDAVHTPYIIGHYEPATGDICILRPYVTHDILFHEFDHALTHRRSESYLGNININSWVKHFGGVYGSHRYSRLLNFPFMKFVSHYATTNDNEQRAEWKRALIMLLYEKWRRCTYGEIFVYYNPLHQFKPNDQWRAMLKWSLDHMEITKQDYESLRDHFQIPR